MYATVCFFPAIAFADRWQDSFVFDAREQRSLVEVESGSRQRTVPFDRQRHAVRAGTPVSLTIRYPKLFTSYRVLVEALEVPDALPGIRGTGQLSSIDLGEQTLPDTKGAQNIETIEIERVTIESVLRAFLIREAARQLMLQIRIDRQKIVDGARTVAADLRELHEAVEPVLGSGPAGPPHDRVPVLTTALKTLRGKLKVPATDFCRLSRTEKSRQVADPNRPREIREWVESTDRHAEEHRRIGRRWRAVGVDGLLDRVIRDAENLDTRMNEFRNNLQAHEAAVELLEELIEEHEGPHLSESTLRDRWVLDFADQLREKYSDLRTAEEFRAIAERFEGELGRKEDSHVAWLKKFAHELRRVIEGSAATVGRTVLETCRECSGSTAVMILQHARERLQKEIDFASRLGCCAKGTPDLRKAVHTAVARVMEARSAIGRELSRLNEEAAKLFNGINTIPAHSRGSELELSLGVYDRNSVVTYRVFEQAPPPRYAVLPAITSELVAVTQGGGVRGDESGATRADAPGEGFRFVGETIFEVHRTYHLAAFGAFTWTFVDTMEYRVGQLEDETRVAREVGTSTAQMSYVVGVKVHPWERDLFPGAGNWRQLGLFVGVPVNRMPRALFGVSWGPFGGVELMAGVHWAKYQKLANGITVDETPLLKAGSDETYSVPLHEGHQRGPLIGVSLDSNIFSSLFGAVAKIGGAF